MTRIGTKAFHFVWRCVPVLLGMTGFRLERLSIPRVAAGLGSFGLAGLVARSAGVWASLSYFGIVWLLYYAGNLVLLATRCRDPERARQDPERAFFHYEALLGVVFLNQGLSVSSLAELPGRLSHFLGVGPLVLLPLGVALVIVGLGTKVWATMIIGLDAYYFRDMFCCTPLQEFAASGPYRWIRNPMYSVGHLHVYGLALISDSPAMLVAAVTIHAGTYAFYYLAERPFVVRSYLARRSESRHDLAA